MAYRIEYDSDRNIEPRGNSRRVFLTASFFACFLWAVCTLWPEGKKLLKILLVPGTPEVTIHAAEVFAQELKNGFSLADAAGNFCQAVLSYGNIPGF